MKTYQDLVLLGDDETARMQFIRNTINEYKNSDEYKLMEVASAYAKNEGPDIYALTKYLYTVTGKRIPDTISADYRLSRGFYKENVMEGTQYLLSNGITWGKDDTADKLGTPRRSIDSQTYKVARMANTTGKAYGFWDMDHVVPMSSLEFLPLYDEEDGAIKAGIKWWQIERNKPFRATLFEMDGYTQYVWDKRTENGTEYGAQVLEEKRAYKAILTRIPVDGEEIYSGENYEGFPIVPMFANQEHICPITGLREQYFAYDAIKSGFCDNVEEASYVFWAIHNAAGMDDVDMARFIEGVKRLKVAKTEDSGSYAEPHILDTPYQSRAELLDRLEADIYKDEMAFNPEKVASGAATATEIQAAYTKLEMKTNDFEYCVTEFLKGIMELAGVDDEPSFTRMHVINVNEEVQTVLSASALLGEEYCVKKILTLLGDGDLAEDVITQKIDDEVTLAREYMNGPGAQRDGETPEGTGAETDDRVQAGTTGDN